MKTIIAGPRYVDKYGKVEYTDYDSVVKAVFISGFDITEVVSGCAKGVDTLGLKYAMTNKIPYAKFPTTPADWQENPKTAGFIRNQKMADYAEALIALWDGKSKGTKDMIDRANRAGLKVFVFRIDKGEEQKKTKQPYLF